MMFAAALASMLLLGAVTPQEDPSSQDPSRETTDLTQLKAGALDLAQARGYRFEADVRISPGLLEKHAQPVAHASAGEAQPERVAYAKEKEDDPEQVSVQLEGEFSSTGPLHLEGEEMEAFRQANKVVYRAEDGTWQLEKGKGAIKAQGHEDEESGQECAAIHWAACVVPAPHELLQNLDAKVTNITREVDEGGLLSSDQIIYRGQLRPDAIAECLKELGGPGQVVCDIRITTSGDGEIEEIELNASRRSSSRAAAAEPATARAKVAAMDNQRPDLSLRFELKDIDEEVEVDVPVAVQQLLNG